MCFLDENRLSILGMDVLLRYVLDSRTFSVPCLTLSNYLFLLLHVKGKPTVDYVADEAPMQSYLNVHIALEQLREIATERGEEGPRVCCLSHRS